MPSPHEGPPAPFRGRQGFTLLEILIAMSIFLVALVALTSLFISATRGYETTERVSVRQQETSAALSVLRYELALAGYRGTCESSRSHSFSDPTFEVARGADTDTITVRYFEDRFPTSCGVEKEVSFYVDELPSGETALFREGAADAEAIVNNVTGIQVFRYVTEEGGLTESMPSAGFVGISLEVRWEDESVMRFIIGLKNRQVDPQES